MLIRVEIVAKQAFSLSLSLSLKTGKRQATYKKIVSERKFCSETMGESSLKVISYVLKALLHDCDEVTLALFNSFTVMLHNTVVSLRQFKAVPGIVVSVNWQHGQVNNFKHSVMTTVGLHCKKELKTTLSMAYRSYELYASFLIRKKTLQFSWPYSCSVH